MKGLTSRNGIWHIDKLVRGTRICRSTDTDDYEEACEILRAVMARVTTGHIDEDWSIAINAACMDSQSWLRRMLGSMKARARKKGFACEFTLAHLKRLALVSNGQCTVSGIPLDLDGNSRSPFRPSIDRIDSSKGYVLENCRLVAYAVNVAMNHWGEETLMIMARSLVAQELRNVTRKTPAISVLQNSKRVSY